MAKAKRGSSVKKGLKFFLFGKYGTWKSSFCLDFMRMKSEEGRPLKVCYIDCESGSIDNYLSDLEDEGIDLNNLFIVYTSSYSETEEWVQKAINNEELFFENEEGDMEVALDAEGNTFIADVIVVDGLTVISDNVKFATINVSEKRAALRLDKDATSREREVAVGSAGLEFKDHDKIKMKGKALLRNMVMGTDKYVVVTAREKIDKQMKTFKNEKTGKNEMQLTEVGVIPDTWRDSEYEFFTVLRTFEDDDDMEIKAQVMRKDRTKVFMQNEIIVHPSPTMWQSVIDNNKGKKANIVVGSSKADIEADEKFIRNENIKPKGKSKSDNDVVEETQSQENSNDSASNLVTVEDYRSAINTCIKAMNKTKKSGLKPVVLKAGLDSNFNKIEDIEDLKKFYALVSK